MTQQFTISVPRPDGTPIPVVVTKKRVKNFNLRVRSDGTAVMSIPWQTNRQKAQAFLDKHRYWLKRSVAQVLEKQPEAPDDGLVPLWGRLVDLPCDLAVDELYHREVTQALPAPVSYTHLTLPTKA